MIRSLYESSLPTVPQDAFANMVNISRIYLSVDVSLSRLEKHSFYNLRKLTHIGLFNTGLTIFPVLTNIQADDSHFLLELSDNPYIPEIPANAFLGITNDLLSV
ncbi:hypothetical protein cypCar_00047272 [Cyprinus carpio]|nr:hypothetical protein cypCar_00047272 [Cyprinus carpio]